jgi:D-tyrosyl-tRNA(Tyr) deacylase
MIAVVQRVNHASVEVEDVGVTGDIRLGLCVLLGVVKGDTEKEAAWIAGKIARLRIFEDESGRFNRSIKDVSGSVLPWEPPQLHPCGRAGCSESPL